MRRTLQTRPAKPFASPTCILAGTGDTIDRDLTDDEIRKVEERIGDYLPNPNESEQDFRFTNYDLGFGI